MSSSLSRIEDILENANDDSGTTNLPDPQSRIEKLLIQLIEKLDGGSGQGNLPNITEDDEGKFLGVVGGEWATTELPSYSGEYSVTPSADAQTLATSKKLMNDDLVINAIPYVEVTNESNGKTVTIG